MASDHEIDYERDFKAAEVGEIVLSRLFRPVLEEAIPARTVRGVEVWVELMDRVPMVVEEGEQCHIHPRRSRGLVEGTMADMAAAVVGDMAQTLHLHQQVLLGDNRQVVWVYQVDLG